MFAIKIWTFVTLLACNYYLININTLDVYARVVPRAVIY